MRAIASLSLDSDEAPWRVDMQTGRHELIGDEPTSAGGQDAGPAPYGYILAGLGAAA